MAADSLDGDWPRGHETYCGARQLAQHTSYRYITVYPENNRVFAGGGAGESGFFQKAGSPASILAFPFHRPWRFLAVFSEMFGIELSQAIRADTVAEFCL